MNYDKFYILFTWIVINFAENAVWDVCNYATGPIRIDRLIEAQYQREC